MSKKSLIFHTSETLNIAALLDEEEKLEEFFVQRPFELNFGEQTEGKIISFHQKLKGYFVETEKKKTAFVPSKEKKTEGEKVFIQIIKEARRKKEATGIFIPKKEAQEDFFSLIKNKFPVELKELSSLEPFIEEALEEEVSFLDGALLTLQKTEAFWSIDVDSACSKKDLKIINKEAVKLIQKQVRLKNMSGMILIDFAGSKPKEEKESLLKEIKKTFKTDERTKIYSFTNMGLFELKRRSQQADIFDLFKTPIGLKHPLYVSYLIERKILNSKSGKLLIKIHPSQEKYLSDLIKKQAKIELELNVSQDYFEIKEN